MDKDALLETAQRTLNELVEKSNGGGNPPIPCGSRARTI